MTSASGGDQQLTRALLSMTDHLVSCDDTVDLLSELAGTVVQLLAVDACGVLLEDELGGLQVVAASSDAARTLELLQLQQDEGPGLDCHRTMQLVSVPDVVAEAATWPAFVVAARTAGFLSVHAVPMRLRARSLGAICLFAADARPLAEEEVELAEALGHLAGIALVAQRAAADQQQLAEQLQHALECRVVIEQCKGLLAATGGVDMDQAFRALRRFARDHNLGLTSVARSVVSRQLAPQVVLGHVRAPRPDGQRLRRPRDAR